MNTFVILHESAPHAKAVRPFFTNRADAEAYLVTRSPEQARPGLRLVVAEIDDNDGIICGCDSENNWHFWWQIDGIGCRECGFDRIAGGN